MFARPWLLLLLIVPVLHLFWVWQRRGRRIAVQVDGSLRDRHGQKTRSGSLLSIAASSSSEPSSA